MKAAMRDRYGPPDVVEVRDVDTPVPEADQVLVRVEAASVNRADLDGLYPRWAFTRLFMGPRTPRQKRVGLDVAGTVEAVGPTVTRFKPGDRVFGDMFAFGGGAFAEFACAPERAFEVTPEGLSFEEAATLPHSAIIAIQGLRLRDGRTIKAGDHVLVDGASGNVGPFAVQVAKARGAEVTGVASPAKLDFVRSLGADHALDYLTTDYTRTGERFDWIIDAYGAHSMRDVARALRPNGVHVMLGGPTSRILESLLLGLPIKLASGKRTGLLIWWKPFNPDDVATLNELLAAGSVRPVIDRRYPLDQVVEALRWVDDGHARGKVVVTDRPAGRRVRAAVRDRYGPPERGPGPRHRTACGQRRRRDRPGRRSVGQPCRPRLPVRQADDRQDGDRPARPAEQGGRRRCGRCRRRRRARA